MKNEEVKSRFDFFVTVTSKEVLTQKEVVEKILTGFSNDDSTVFIFPDIKDKKDEEKQAIY